MTRDDAINELKCAIDLIKQDGKDWLDERDISVLQMAIEALDRKSGEWIYKQMKGQFCSVCDMQSVWKYNFCPNCGADMRGDND